MAGPKQLILLDSNELAKEVGMCGPYIRKLSVKPGFPKHWTPKGFRFVTEEFLHWKKNNVRKRSIDETTKTSTQGEETDQNSARTNVLKALADPKTDPHLLLRTILTDPNISNEDRRAFVTVVSELRKRKESDSKQAKLFSAPKVTEYLRSIGEAWTTNTEAHLPEIANRILEHIREQFSIDILDNNVAAKSIIEAFLRVQMNEIIKAVNKQIEVVEQEVTDE